MFLNSRVIISKLKFEKSINFTINLLLTNDIHPICNSMIRLNDRLFDNSRTYYNFDRTIKVSLHDRNNSIENFLTSTIYKEKNTLLREESFHPLSKTITLHPEKSPLLSSSSRLA